MKTVFLRKLTYANLKRNLQEQIRYTLRNKDQDDLCEDLVLMLTDTLNEELKDKVGPEDILSESQLEELQDALNESARRTLKTNRMQISHMKRLEARVKRAIERTLVAPQVERLTEVRTVWTHSSLIDVIKFHKLCEISPAYVPNNISVHCPEEWGFNLFHLNLYTQKGKYLTVVGQSMF